jgi:hypothetical protein
MGIINRLKSGAGRVKNGLKHIHEEARYPGRPASYNATDNPLWADKDVVRVTTGQEPPPRAEGGGSVASEGKSETKSRTERPWFLDGEQEDEGWDGTNPGEAWSGNKTETDPTEQ